MLMALVLFDSVYLAEIVRAGIRGVPPGQFESARALGLGYGRAMQRVILPQALRSMLPSLVNQFISTIKETSLGYIIGLTEVSFIAAQINTQVFTHATQVYLLLGLTYFVLCFGLSRVAFLLEKRLSAPGAGPARPGRLAGFPNLSADACRMIQFNNVNKWFGDYHALVDVERDHRPGRGRGGLRAVRLGQVHADPHHQPGSRRSAPGRSRSTARTSTAAAST